MDTQDMEVESPIYELEDKSDDVDDSDEDCEDTIDHGIVAPHVGMEFPSEDAAYHFYNAYACRIGFGIRKHTTNKSSSGSCISRILVCNKEGFKPSTNSKRVSTRVGCNARLKIICTKLDTWKVSIFEDKHNNHELTSPSKVSKHRSHRCLHRIESVKRLITEINEEGLGPAANAKVVNKVIGSQGERITAQQISDHVRIARKSNIGRECVQVMKYFHNKQLSDPKFYFALDIDEHDQTMRSMFWTDERSRDAYLDFGDVIVFDVTYKTNKFSLPFAPFTGVNHHRQSILFGCALLADEKEHTFVWLFEQWLKCMWGKAPEAIITDQDLAICNAIARVFPQSRHRYCKWHLDKHISEQKVHLKGCHGEDIEDDLNRLELSTNLAEAEKCWNEMNVKYQFNKQSWVSKLWDKRCHWIPCYLKDVFLAGMKTSQRSESINAFFDGFVNSQTPLDVFMTQYEKAITTRRNAESDEDFRTLESLPALLWQNEMEKQAAKCYTRTMFAMFQEELKEGALFWTEKVSKEGHVSKYRVGREPKSMKIVVYDDSDGVRIFCECAKFEMEGLLCKHALNVLNKKRIVQIPDHYILKRWTINARYRMHTIGSIDNTSGVTEVNELLKWTVHAKWLHVFEEGVKSMAILKGLDLYLSNVLAEIDNGKKATIEHASQVISSALTSNIMEQTPEITIHDPRGRRKCKGRPPNSYRIKGGIEKSQEASTKKMRRCGNCGIHGHKKTTCPQTKAKDATTSGTK